MRRKELKYKDLLNFSRHQVLYYQRTQPGSHLQGELRASFFTPVLPYPPSPLLYPLSHSGYDFGYLIRLLTNLKLPDKEKDFFELLSIFFPKLYDVKYLMKSCKSLKGGLQEVADSLEVGLTRLARGRSV